MFFEKAMNTKTAKEFEEILNENNFRGNAERFFQNVFWQAFLLAAVTAVACAVLGFPVWQQLFFTCGAFVLWVFFRVFYHYYFFDYKKRKMEALMPDFLVQASLFPKGSSLVEIISYFSKSNYKYLSKEFRKCIKEIGKGASPELSLQNFKKRNRSKIIGRAVDLLVEGIKSGADSAAVFKETAEDLLETSFLARERTASLVVEKYTLLFAGGIIVPLILGIVAGMLQQLDFSALSEIGIGLSQAQRKSLLEAALFANTLYLAEYALIASFFVAFQESDLKKTAIYALILIPLSLAVFVFFRNF